MFIDPRCFHGVRSQNNAKLQMKIKRSKESTIFPVPFRRKECLL